MLNGAKILRHHRGTQTLLAGSLTTPLLNGRLRVPTTTLSMDPKTGVLLLVTSLNLFGKGRARWVVPCRPTGNLLLWLATTKLPETLVGSTKQTSLVTNFWCIACSVPSSTHSLSTYVFAGHGNCNIQGLSTSEVMDIHAPWTSHTTIRTTSDRLLMGYTTTLVASGPKNGCAIFLSVYAHSNDDFEPLLLDCKGLGNPAMS